jgi:PBP1b-binding outer membrane lipoprotein LpoB
MFSFFRFACALALALFLTSCAEQQPQRLIQSAGVHRLHNVRTPQRFISKRDGL